MNLYLHFILVNSEFNQGLADDLYEGQETEDNIKFLWEDELKVKDSLKDFKIKNNSSYTLAGFYSDNTPFSFEIDDMTTVDCIAANGKQIQFAVSKKVIREIKLDKENMEEQHIYFYLKDKMPLENPMEGIYILKTQFPKELKKKKNG